MDSNISSNEFGPNQGYINELFTLYQIDPELVSADWRQYFSRYQVNTTEVQGRINLSQTEDWRLQESVFRYVDAFRKYGHLKAEINPLALGIVPLPSIYQLDNNFYNFTEEQLNQEVLCYHFQNKQSMILKDLIKELHRVYSGSIGFEYEHILDPDRRYWLRERIEDRLNTQALTIDESIARLKDLIDAEVFEDQLHKKYIGQKRFSLEGGETLIPVIKTIINEACGSDVHEIVLGMAHRGRLNVLRNILGKPLQEIFFEFEDKNPNAVIGSGDVKYHLGFESTFCNAKKEEVQLSLAPNPSHLEFVYPVIEGMCRAKQDLNYQRDRKSVLPLALHGDAAFIGQGVVAETLNFANVSGYCTGGTIHLVINNQIGFTTTPDESRSSVYCTSFANAIEAPVLHVNAEDVEAACWAAKLALDYRNTFGQDIVLDLYCYRKYGHNEGDDPNFTQPLLYQGIKQKKLISEYFLDSLTKDHKLTAQQIIDYRTQIIADFDREQSALRLPRVNGDACPMHGRLRSYPVAQDISKEKFQEVLTAVTNFPKNFTVYPKLDAILKKRADIFDAEQGVDWGMAEILAYGTLIQDGINVRLSGQDCGRGTFSHRHLMLNDSKTGAHYLSVEPLINQYHTDLDVLNSTLSETGILAFEFGYSTVALNSLVIWEAQFGDFGNGAQVIIDQFIASSEQKWNQLSGIVLLLPHGFEGQGPEHSSARLERYLQLCADGNMVVFYPTTTSQIFHLLRAQAMSSIKRPLVIMSPKSLLRSPSASSKWEQLAQGSFETIFVNNFPAKKTRKKKQLVFTTGKIYYDLEKALLAREDLTVQVIRVEQLYPFPQFEIKKAIKDFEYTECIWIQEEPLNMGAWLYIEPYLRTKLDLAVTYIGRETSASPATGSPRRHEFEQKGLISELLVCLEENI